MRPLLREFRIDNAESSCLSHAAEALVCTDEGIEGNAPVKGEGGRELKGIQGAKASSDPMLLNDPLGLAVMDIGHADDAKLVPGIFESARRTASRLTSSLTCVAAQRSYSVSNNSSAEGTRDASGIVIVMC